MDTYDKFPFTVEQSDPNVVMSDEKLFSTLSDSEISVPDPTLIPKNSVVIQAPRDLNINKDGLKNNTPSQPDPRNMVNSTDSYISSYDETKRELQSTINQMDMITIGLQNELEHILSSNYKGKHTSISLIGNTLASLISSKVNALKEINKITTDSHNLDMKRAKDMFDRTNADTGVNEQEILTSLYKSMIDGTSPMTSIFSGSRAVNPQLYQPLYNDIGQQPNDSQVSIEQNVFNSMVYENDPNVKTVVVYNQDTGDKWFEMINMLTGAKVPNVDLPDSMFLENIAIDKQNMIAKNKDLDTVYDLVLLGGGISNY